MKALLFSWLLLQPSWFKCSPQQSVPKHPQSVFLTK